MVTTEASASSGKLGLRQRRSLTVMYNTPHYVDKDGYNTGSGSSGDGFPKLQVGARGTDSQNCKWELGGRTPKIASEIVRDKCFDPANCEFTDRRRGGNPVAELPGRTISNESHSSPMVLFEIFHCV